MGKKGGLATVSHGPLRLLAFECISYPLSVAMAMVAGVNSVPLCSSFLSIRPLSYVAAIPQCLLIDLETGYLPSVTVPCHWFAPGGCAISIPCPCSTFREDDDATPHCAATLPHSLSISCNATGDSLMGRRVHQRRGNRSFLANLIAIKQDSTFQISF